MVSAYTAIRKGVFDCLDVRSYENEEYLFNVLRDFEKDRDVTVTISRYEPDNPETVFDFVEPSGVFEDGFYNRLPGEDINHHARLYPEDDAFVKLFLRTRSFSLRWMSPKFITNQICVFPRINEKDYEMRFDIKGYRPRIPSVTLKPAFFTGIPTDLKNEHLSFLDGRPSFNNNSLEELGNLTGRINAKYLNYIRGSEERIHEF
jgi:hypothetical protein